MIRKITALLLSVMLVTPSLCIAQAEDTPSETSVFEASEYGEETMFLRDWGIINNTGSENESSNTVTRGEFAVLVIRALGLEGVAASSTSAVFSDVPQSHYANGYVSLAVSLGLMNGVGEERFDPNAEITMSDAIAVAVKMINFGTEAIASGGYPSGYLSVAAKHGLMKNVKKNEEGKPARRGDIYTLLYNTVHADMAMYVQDGVDQKLVVYKDRNILTENNDIYEVTGIVEADNNYAVSGNKTVDKGSIVIDGIFMQSDKTSTENVVGRNVHCYYKDNGNDGYSVVAAYPEDNKIINITPSEVDYFDYINGVYELSSGSKSKRIRIGSRYTLIYNGDRIDGSDKSMMLPQEGKITLIDNNKDDVYEVIFIEEYYNLILDSFDAYKNILYDKYGDDEVCGGRFTRNVELDEFYEVVCRSDISKLDQDTVISVYKSVSKDKVTLTVPQNAVSGIMTSKFESDDKIIELDGEEYRLSNDCRCDFETLRVGETVIVYLDAQGKAAFIKSNMSRKSGYVLKSVYEENEELAYIKLLSSVGENTYKCRNKVNVMTIDGTKKVAAKDIADLFRFRGRGFILIETNDDNEISKIIMPYVVSSQEEFDSLPDYPLYKMDYYINNWPLGSNTTKYRKDIYGYDNWLIFDSKAIAYTVPPEDEDYDTENINASAISAFPDKTTSELWKNEAEARTVNQIDVYKIGSQTELPNVLIRYAREYSPQITEDAAPAVISKINEVYDDDAGRAATAVSLIENGKEAEYLLSEEDLRIGSSGIQIGKGDIVKYSLDKNSKIKRLELQYSAAESKLLLDEAENYNSVDRIYRLAVGKVIKKRGNYLEIEMSYDDDSKLERYNFNAVKAVVVDSKEKKVTAGTSDLISLGDKVVIYSRYLSNRLVVIYKD